VGTKVQHGKPVTLRLVCDGLRYMVLVDGEPVLYRALTDVYADYPPIAIHKVGLITNGSGASIPGACSVTSTRASEAVDARFGLPFSLHCPYCGSGFEWNWPSGRAADRWHGVLRCACYRYPC